MKFLTTGIGSVPFKNLRDAMPYVFEFSVPFLPELPGADFMDRTLSMAAGKLPIEIQSFAVEVARRRPQQAKLQMAGPLTMKYFKPDAWAKMGQKGYREAVLSLIRAMRAETNVELCLFLDEPAIDSALEEDEAQLIKDCLTYVQVEGVRTGIHCCNTFDMSDLLKLKPHFLSFDLTAMQSELEAASADVTRYLDANGTLVWGAVAAHKGAKELVASEEALKLIPRFSRSEVWVSPTCGLATLTEQEAKKIPSKLASLATAL